MYLWNIRDKIPFIEHKVEFQKEVLVVFMDSMLLLLKHYCVLVLLYISPSLMSLSFQSDWLYVGMEGGNVYLVHVNDFEVSGYNIYWDKVAAHEP